ncbi:MAG: hypothetical protein CR217_12700 [Beijerinckiaceae bacterium]|nr:MAG: hypothetical protein CR217_12700 [Beijerinckiaceae bacterium]
MISLALTSLANAQKFYFYTISEPAICLPPIMLPRSISLDFRRQRHHVKLSALMWTLPIWPRGEPARVSLPSVQSVFLRSPSAGRRLKNSVAAAPDFPARAPAQRKTNN